MVLHDNMWHHGPYQKIHDHPNLVVQKLLDQMPKMNIDPSVPGPSSKMKDEYSKACPSLKINPNFYDEVMQILDDYFRPYRSRQLDLSQHSGPSLNEPWVYRPVMQPINISNPPINSVKYSNYNNNPVLQPINTSNSPVNSMNYCNYNNNPVLQSIYTSNTPANSVNNNNFNNNSVLQPIYASNTPATGVNNTNYNNNPVFRSLFTSNTHVTGVNNTNYNNNPVLRSLFTSNTPVTVANDNNNYYKKPVLQPTNISDSPINSVNNDNYNNNSVLQQINTSVNSVNNGNYNNNPVLQPINTSNTPVNSAYYSNYNNNLKNFTNNNTLKNQLSNTQVSVLVRSPGSIDSISVDSSSTSPMDFEEPVITPVKDVSKNNVKSIKSLEENNNKVHFAEEDRIKNESMSSESSRSDSIDEKTVSYAEIIKYSKPSKPKQIELNEESKKIEPAKSNRVPPSKKMNIKLPDGPFLPNNQFCAFCKNNCEDESVYRTHFVKDELGNVKCPILLRYTCPTCGATGTKAHTISRCPKANKKKKNQ